MQLNSVCRRKKSLKFAAVSAHGHLKPCCCIISLHLVLPFTPALSVTERVRVPLLIGFPLSFPPYTFPFKLPCCVRDLLRVCRFASS